jgi:molybdate/tungstate transport system substrate-binding protein
LVNLIVFTAGVAMGLVKDTAAHWDATHPDLTVSMKPGGSVDLVRDVAAGAECDLLISADDSIIKDMLMPAYADSYTIFAGNKMVIAATDGYTISSDDWKEKLLAEDATFFHFNPYGDPGGYRAVMSILLADKYEEGLTDKLMNHPGHLGMDPSTGMRNAPPFKYMFGYYSGPASRGMSFAELPAVMDLSDDDLADVYATAKFPVDDDHTVTGTPIAHALTIPLASEKKAAAEEFAQMILDTDLAGYHFLPRYAEIQWHY